MKRTFSLFVLVTLLALMFSAGNVTPARAIVSTKAYVRSEVGAPWGESTNETAMDTEFGAGAWSDLRYESVNASDLFSTLYDFVFLEGGDNNADELEAFLTANQSLIQNWVADGGALFINAAPNEGDGMSYGFGGVQLNYSQSNFDSNASDWGEAVDASHSIFNGPAAPVGTSFTGNSFSHATVSGGGAIPVIIGENGTNLSELEWGSGCVMFGGMTTTNFQYPQPEAFNLRVNILDYLDNCSGSGYVPTSASFTSAGAFDGQITESRENSDIGGGVNAVGVTLNIGDTQLDQQVVSILHFDTSSLPDGAVVTGLSLQLKQYQVVGTNTFKALGPMIVDIAKPSFGTTALTNSDFQALASQDDVSPSTVIVGTIYQVAFASTAASDVNLTGVTQLRLKFNLDDNDNFKANLIRFFSGNGTAAYRPTLTVYYYVP